MYVSGKYDIIIVKEDYNIYVQYCNEKTVYR